MLFVGTQTNDQDRRIEIDFDGLLHHALIVGQSGSGKSFLVARLIEEILVRSRARILIIDPNGDFRQISTPSADVWPKFSEAFERLDRLSTAKGIESFDTQEMFERAWEKRRFIYLSPTRSAPAKKGGAATNHRLVVHWDTLEDEQRTFLLNADSSTEPRMFLGLKAVAENARWVSQHRPDVGVRMDLRGLLEVAQQFAESNIGMREYEYAKILNREDWYAVQAKIDDLLSQYSVWWSSADRWSRRPPGLADFVDGSFGSDVRLPTYWDALVLSLEAAPAADTLLSADVALSRLWYRAKNEWRLRAEGLQNSAKEPDKRVPTFIVVDEAHNFAPDRSTDPLRDRLTSRLMQIASEGRKYGLYLILASQRPTKLHRELVAECENACVLRLQSKIETDFAVKVLGLSEAEAHAVPSFTKGQGVFIGRWVGGTTQLNTKVAPARIVVGGGELDGAWKSVPEATPVQSDELLAAALFVQETLQQSDAPLILPTLAWQLRGKFGERAQRWFGPGTFKRFLLDLDIDGLTVSSTPPGYAFLVKLPHTAPSTVRKAFQFQLLPNEANGDSQDEQVTIGVVFQTLNMPFLPTAEFAYLFQAISEEVQANEFNLTDTSKAVRDKCIAAGHPIGRNIVSFTLKGISLGGHLFDVDLPQSPPVLAAAFTKSIMSGLDRNAITLTVAEREMVARYFSGGLYGMVESVPSPKATETLGPKAEN